MVEEPSHVKQLSDVLNMVKVAFLLYLPVNNILEQKSLVLLPVTNL